MSMPAFPSRFTVSTYNIWTWTRWPERQNALRQFAIDTKPDIACFQEVQAESRATIDEAWSETHTRVDDEFQGWTDEGSIYWRRDLFEEVEHGAEDIGILETLRRLFWVRLRILDSSDRTLLVATAHYTWHGHAVALETEKNVRIPQARATVAFLDRMKVDGEPQLFMGDLNDSNEPIFALRDGGFTDCFTAMGRRSAATYPAIPTAMGVPQTIDWMMSRGGLRVLNAEVLDYYAGDLAASDHKPVLATFER